MKANQTEQLAAVISSSFAKAIEPVIARLKAAEEQLREAGAINRALADRVKALEARPQ
jgi:hypothetical protein